MTTGQVRDGEFVDQGGDGLTDDGCAIGVRFAPQGNVQLVYAG